MNSFERMSKIARITLGVSADNMQNFGIEEGTVYDDGGRDFSCVFQVFQTKNYYQRRITLHYYHVGNEIRE